MRASSGVLAAALAALLVGAGSAAGLYAYLPDVLVVSTGDDADTFLTDLEVSLGVEASDDPDTVDRPDLKRLDRLVRVMERHWANLDDDCDPNAVFALMYLITTYGVRSHIEEGYFDDNDYMSIITVAFAKLYLDAYDDWKAGDLDRVQLGWREAFDHAASGQSSIVEDQFLGMNAHINYDLAVAIASLGTYSDAGEWRKPDLDRINHVLVEVTDDVGYWTAYYYGPEPPDGAPPAWDAEPAPESWLVLEPIAGWREAAWWNAEAIEDMPDATTRAAHDDAMQANTWTVAQGFQSPKLTSPAPERIAYCQAHG